MGLFLLQIILFVELRATNRGKSVQICMILVLLYIHYYIFNNHNLFHN